MNSRKFVISLIGAILSGSFFLYHVGQIQSGNISVWPQTLIGFLFFAVFAPMATYYNARRGSINSQEKFQEILDQQSFNQQEDNRGKK